MIRELGSGWSIIDIDEDDLVRLLQADEGAIRVGARIVKTGSEPGDLHPVGARGTVVAGHTVGAHGPLGFVEHGYFVVFDGSPAVTFCVDKKITEVEGEHHEDHA